MFAICCCSYRNFSCTGSPSSSTHTCTKIPYCQMGHAKSSLPYLFSINRYTNSIAKTFQLFSSKDKFDEETSLWSNLSFTFFKRSPEFPVWCCYMWLCATPQPREGKTVATYTEDRHARGLSSAENYMLANIHGVSLQTANSTCLKWRFRFMAPCFLSVWDRLEKQWETAARGLILLSDKA